MKQLETIKNNYGFPTDEDGEVVGHTFNPEGLLTISGVGKAFDEIRARHEKQVRQAQEDEQPSAEAA